MKIKSLLSLLLVAVFLLSIGNTCFAADCRNPSDKDISLDKSGQHSATAKIYGVTRCSGMNNYENRLIVRIEVKVGVRPSDAIKWYSETSKTVSNSSSASKTQTVTPVAHYLLGAQGSWSATCNICNRSSNGSIAYKN